MVVSSANMPTRRKSERTLILRTHGSPLEGSSMCVFVCMRERNVLASSDFRLRCDSRRSFRRAIRGEFLDAAMFLSTRCFNRTFSRFGSEAGQFFSRLLVGHCHTVRARGWGVGGGGGRTKGTGTRYERRRRRLALAFTFARSYYRLAGAQISRERSTRMWLQRGLLVTLVSGQAGTCDL